VINRCVHTGIIKTMIIEIGIKKIIVINEKENQNCDIFKFLQNWRHKKKFFPNSNQTHTHTHRFS
jgi:hypothetical protein